MKSSVIGGIGSLLFGTALMQFGVNGWRYWSLVLAFIAYGVIQREFGE